MYGQEPSKPRRSFDEIARDVDEQYGDSSSAPSTSKKKPRRSFDQIASDVAAVPFGPEVTPDMLPQSKSAAPSSPKERRLDEAVNAIQEINRRKNQAAELFRDAGNVQEGAARTAMQLQAQATLDSANQLGRETAKRHKGSVEIGFGRDADPNSKREWVYAKPIDQEVGNRYTRRVQTEQRAKDVQAYRREYEGSNPVSQFAQDISTRYLSGRPDKTPEEEKELSIRREAMGLPDTATAPGWVADKAGRVARATVNAIPAAASGLANISDTVYRRAQSLTGNRLPQSADWAPYVEPIAREVESAVAPIFPVDPKRNEDFSSKVASGFGSAAGFGTVSKVSSAARIPSRVAVGTAGAGMGVDEIVQEARAAGFDPARDPGRWDRMIALAGTSGMTEIFGFGKMLDRWGLKRQFTKRALEVLEEGGQEALQQFLGNVNAAQVGQYEKDRGLGKDIIENALIGGIVGGGAQAADIASDYIRRPAAIRATQNEPLRPLDLKPSAPVGTQTQVVSVPESGKFRTRPFTEQADAAPIVDQQAEAARQVADPAQPVVAPAMPSAIPLQGSQAIPVASPSVLFPEKQADEASETDLSELSPQERLASMLDRLKQKQAGRQAATLEQGLNKDFAESSAMISSAAQSWDVDRPTAELMATTGVQRLKSALQNLQKSEAYQMELGAVASAAGQPGPYIAAAQSIQRQLDQADSLFKLDAERERQQAELEAQAARDQKKAEKEQFKQDRFAQKEQQKLDRKMLIEQKRAETQNRRDEASAKRMAASEASKQKRRGELEQIRQQARDEKASQQAQRELERIALHDAALQAADVAGQRHQEYINQGQFAEAINELTVQQNQLRDAVKHLPRTPEAQNIKADLNRYQGQIGNRIGDLRKQANGRNVPVTQAIPPLFQPGAAVNPEGGVPDLPSFYEPGAVFDRLAPTLGDVEEDSTPLLTAIRRAGGIANDSISPGELRRLGVKESGTTGLVNNRGGLAPDRMREAMVEAGYLADDSTVDDLFQAIEGELRAGQRRSQPKGSIADFYDEWEQAQGDGETDGRKTAYYAEEKPPTADRRPPIEEFADDVEADDLEALQRAVSRSQRDNPRPYGERTRPGEPGSGLVSFSQYAELEARNPEQEQALYNNEPGSETFNDAIDWITEDAAKAGIGQNHVDAMVAYALNWHGEKAFWESQGLSMDTVQQAIDSVAVKREQVLADAKRLPVLQRTEIEREVAALDLLFDDTDAVNLLVRAAQGEDNAVNEFNRVADEYGINEETAGELIRARRPARRKQDSSANAAPERIGSDPQESSKTRSGESEQPRHSAKPSERDLQLLKIRPSEVPDQNFDRYMMAVEDLWARAVRGEVDIDPQTIYNPAHWVAESDTQPRKAGILAQIRADRFKRRDENRLPARENLAIIDRYMNADLAELAAPKKEGRISRLQQILQATRITLEKNPSGAPAEWMRQVRDLHERAQVAQLEYDSKTVSHPNPDIDGKPVLAKTDDGRVIVENSNNKSGISVVKDNRSSEKPENAIIPSNVSGHSANSNDLETGTEPGGLGEQGLPGSQRGISADQRTAAETGVSGLPAGSRRGNVEEGSRANLGDTVPGRPASGGETAELSAKPAESGRSAQPDDLSESKPPRAPERDRRVPRARIDQSGQSDGTAVDSGNQSGAVAEPSDSGLRQSVSKKIDEPVRAGVKGPTQQADLFSEGVVNERGVSESESVREGQSGEPSGEVSENATGGDRQDSQPGGRASRRGDRKGDGSGQRSLGDEGTGSSRSDELVDLPAFVDQADTTRTETQSPSAAHRPSNHQITDIEDVVPSGKKSKLEANLAAIRLLRDLQAQGRRPTADEQAVLGKFVGWGQFPYLFNDINEAGKKLATERDELQKLLSPEEYERAKRSTLNAHYTSPRVVQKMWEMVDRLGFKGGRVLEPSMGVGYFYGLMPRTLMASSKLAGVELDPITGTIARMLYPDASINVKGFQDVKIADGFYDLVIGNVPFGDFRVHDPAYNKYRANIHDYFILKSLDKTRPGGIVAVITSTGTMDKADSRIRREISSRANLVAAMRFPDSAFEKNAGTQVVTDLLIFQKLAEGQKPDAKWTELDSLPDPDGGEAIPISKYYVQNPGMILGTLDRKSKLYGGGQSHVSTTPDFAQRFEAAIRAIPEGILTDKTTAATEPTEVASAVEDKTVEGGYVLRDGRVLQRKGDAYVVPSFEPSDLRKVTALLKVRDALNALNSAQMTTGETAEPRQALVRAYDYFVAAYGPIRKLTNTKLLAQDPSGYLLQALEKSYDSKTGKAVKADIFTKDTIARTRSASDVSSPSSAVAVSLFETGKVDLDRIAELLNVKPDEARKQLLKDGLAFENPRGEWESSEAYLSGNVRKKLIEAREAAAVDEKYQVNVDALEKVQPADVPIEMISVKLGASWLPAEDVKNFAAHLMQTDASRFNIQYMPTAGTWLVSGRIGSSKLATEVYGTSRADFIDVLDAALNDRPIKIYDKTRDGSVFNLEESEKATAKVQEVRDQFADWLWMDHERTHRLHRYYNDNFNNMRVIQYTGEHYRNADGKFVLPGMNPAIALRPNQVKDVWQAVANGKLLDASEVGAGKTFILGSIAMEWKRLGIARKPAIAVPKPRIAATVAELQLQYPAAKILSLEKSFDKENRKKTTAQMATGDYDMVVLSHEQLDKMPMSADVIQEFIGAELLEIEERIKDAEAAAEEAGDKQMGNRIVKRLEKIKERVEARLQEALDGTSKDDVVQFEETGIDALLVDEAHGFKSLPVYSRRSDVKGVPTTRSDRATNMLMRTRWLMRQNNNKGVVFATGTPVTNTLAEVYNLQRYLQPEILEERGLENFDAWADQFANISTQFEYTAAGDYKAVSRMAEFVNLPELQQSIRQIMATNFVDDMTWIARPKKIEQVITSPMTDSQQAYLQDIRSRVERLKKMSPRERKESGENFLLISTDARKSALSPAMVRPGSDSGGKIERLAETVLRIHKDRPDVAQMIFLDFGVNPNHWGYSVYDDIQNRLVLGGIPKERIANFARLSDVARQKAADKLNSGEYLIGIGSSGKMGTGINAQKRLAAMHHMDAPWLPAYLEQRNGRGHRQGNLNDPTKPADEQIVEAYYYTTEGSFDVVMWQALSRKSEFIRQFMRGDTSVREMRMDDTGDEDTGEMGPEMILAATSGNPFELDRIRLIKDVEKLERQERSHRQQVLRFKTQVASAGREQEETRNRIAQTEKDAEQFEATKGQKFTVTINGKTYEDRKVAGNQLAFATIEAPPRDVTKLGEYRGFELYVNKTAGNPIVYLERDGGREYRFVLNLAEPEPAFTSADANLRSSVQQVGAAREHLEQLLRDEETAKAEIDKPFKRATELKDKREALARVEQKMAEWMKRKDQPDVERRPGKPQVTRLDRGEMAARSLETAKASGRGAGSNYWGTPRVEYDQEGNPVDEASIIPNARAEFRSNKGQRAGTLWTNEQGAIVLGSAADLAGVRIGTVSGGFSGLAMSLPSARKTLAALKGVADDYGPEVTRIADEFEKAIQETQRRKEQAVVIVDISSQSSLYLAKATAREERYHQWQQTSGLMQPENAQALERVLRDDPVYQHIRTRLLEDEGYVNHPGLLITEAAAKIASGQWQDYNLESEQQGLNFLHRYMRAAVRLFGRRILAGNVPGTTSAQEVYDDVKELEEESETQFAGRDKADSTSTRRSPGIGEAGRSVRTGKLAERIGREDGAGLPETAQKVAQGGNAPRISLFGGSAQPKTTPLREIITEHKPLQVDPYKIQDKAIEEILNAAGRGVAGTLPGARALYWAGKLKMKPVANKLANRQAKFIEGAITNTNEIIAAFEAMQAAKRGSEAYQKARSEMYKARRELHAKLQRTGEYSGPVEYLAKYAKAAVLTAPHILTNNILDHLASFPVHEAQKLMGFLLPVRVLRRWGVDVERTHVDFRDLVPAIGREIGAVLKGTKDALPDFVHSLRHGTTDLLLDEEIARQQIQQEGDEAQTGGADRYELGKRAKGVPGLDQILTAIGRTHGAVDVAGRRWAFATAISSQADAIAKRVGKENGFSQEEVAALREDLAAEPSPQMVVLAMDEANRFVLDYPTFLYKLIQTARTVGEKEHPTANKVFNNALDFLVKFQKIPLAAQAQSLWHYSPFGLVAQGNRVRRAAKAKKEGKPISAQQSAEIVERLQQGALGALVWAATGLLGSLGYLHYTGGDDRERVRNAQEAMGLGYDPELIVGDTAVTMNKLGTFGRAGSVAARLAKAAESRRDVKSGEPESDEARAKRLGKAFMKGVVLDNPVGRGLGDFFTSEGGDPVQNFARGQIRSLQPGILRTIAKVQDGTKRIPDDTSFTSKVAADFKTGNPLYRQTLQPRLDALGRPVEEDNPFTFTRNVKREPQLEEMAQLGTGPSKPQRDGGELAIDYNQRVTEQGSKTVKAMRRISEDAKQAGRSDVAKGRIYYTDLSTDGLKRADKVSEESLDTEREIEALRADAYEALRKLPSYQRMKDSEKASARQQIDEQLKSFRARAESTRRNKKTGRVSVVREKAAQLPDYEPLALARAAVLSAQQ